MIYKTLKKVSDYCQLLDKSKYHKTLTINGVTFTNNGDGTITINGTATNEIYYTIFSFGDSLSSSHKYLVTGENSGLYLFVENRDKDNKILAQLVYNEIRSLPANTKRSTYVCYIKTGAVCDNLVLKPQLFDLTEMYGAGHEPTTVEQFRQDFPEEMYSYSPYCFVTSYKNYLKVSDVCQLLDKSKYPATKTVNGVTFTNNGDGTITVNGTAEEEIYYNIQNIGINRLKFSINIHLNSNHIREIRNNILFEYVGYDKSNGQVFFHIQKGGVCENIVAKPQILDLTEMYGVGNEPTTVDQFRQDFPEEMYDYKPYSIIPSYKKSLVCKTKNLFDALGREDANPTGNWPITKYDVGNVIYRGFAYSGYYQLDEPYKCDVTVSGPVINVVEKIRNYGIGYIVKCNPDTVYTLSYETNFNVIVSIFLDLEGNKLGEGWSRTFTTPNNAYYLLVSFASTTAGTYFIKNLQLELGDTATEYHPYGYL